MLKQIPSRIEAQNRASRKKVLHTSPLERLLDSSPKTYPQNLWISSGAFTERFRNICFTWFSD